MDLQRLHYFVAVADELHFGRAAERLHMTQPALSRQIQHLEEELGVQLLFRTKRRVTLSMPGELFFERAKLVLRQAEQAATLVRMADRGMVGEVSVGFVESASLKLLPDTLRAFRQQHPAVHVSLYQLLSVDQIPALKDGRIDLGLLRASATDAELEFTPLLREPWIAALPVGHPLAERPELSLTEFADQPLIVSPPAQDWGVFSELWRLCREAGFTPRVTQEASAMLPVLGLVAGGIGIALVPGAIASIAFPHVVYRPVAAPLPSLELELANRRAERAPAVLALRRQLIEMAPTLGGQISIGQSATAPPA